MAHHSVHRIICANCVIGAAAYAAMFGWDKFTALWSRLKTMLNK